MDSQFVMLVLMGLISTVCSVEKSTAHPLQTIGNIPNEEVANVPPFYGHMPEIHEPYFNPGLYGPSAYGFENMFMHQPRGRPFPMPYSRRHSMHPFMGMPMAMPRHYHQRVPPQMAYWKPRKLNYPATSSVIPSITPSASPVTIPSVTPSTIPSTAPTAAPTSPPEIPSVATAATEISEQPISEKSTQAEVVAATEAQIQQKDEQGEEPKQRHLSNNLNNNNCGPAEEPTAAAPAAPTAAPAAAPTAALAGAPTAALAAAPTAAPEAAPTESPVVSLAAAPTAALAVHTGPPTVVLNEEPAVAIAAPEPNAIVVPEAVSATEVAVPSEEEATISHRRHNIETPLDAAMPPIPPVYPGKSLYNSVYPPMPYLSAMGMDPYAALNRINMPGMFPGRFYGY